MTTTTRRGFLQRAAATLAAAIILPATIEENAAEARRIWQGTGPGRWNVDGGNSTIEAAGFEREVLRVNTYDGPMTLVGPTTSAEALRYAERPIVEALASRVANYRFRYRVVPDGAYSEWIEAEPLEVPRLELSSPIRISASVPHEFQIQMSDSRP